MKLKPGLKSLLMAFVFCICSVGPGIAQENPSIITFKVKQGEVHPFQVSSTTVPTFQILSNHNDWGAVLRNEDVNGDQVYDIDYTAPTDFEGIIEFQFTYTAQNPFPFYNYSRQVKVIAEIVASVVDPHDDVILLTNDESVIFDPSLNDVFSEDHLIVKDIPFVHHGTTRIIDDNLIEFTPSDDFAGRAQLEYVVEDNLGTEETGIVYFLSEVSNYVQSSIDLTVSSETKAYIFMPVSSLTLSSQSGNKGQVNGITEMAYEFVPIAGKLGKDILIFSNDAGQEFIVNINVLDNAPDLDAVKDDEVYTAIDQPVSFNVSENDFIDPSAISYFSPELTYEGAGIFSYLPPSGFNGFKSFIYKVNTGSKILTGNIKIKIDNYFPKDILYQFETPRNTELILEYDVPIENYTFTNIGSPKYGDLEIFGEENISIDCGSLSNLTKIIYTPRNNFIGYDEFQVEYCTAVGNCKIVKSKVSVYNNGTEECPCLVDCVFPGDANSDGLVALSDLLSIGYYMGEGGPSRLIQSTEWHGQNAESWGFLQVNGKDAKHLDANGDGRVNSIDTVSIQQNLDRYASFIPLSIERQVKSPIKLVPQSNEYTPGELFLIDVFVGDDQFPVLDMHGLNFSLNLDPEIFDLESTVFIPLKDSWLAEGFGTITMSNSKESGKFDISITKTTGLPKSGRGKIGTFATVGVEEIEGFFPDEEVEIPIEIIDNLGMDSKGNTYQLALQTTTISLKQSLRADNSKAINRVFPNPASDLIHVFTGINETEKQVRITDISGKNVLLQKVVRENLTNIDVSNLVQGVYLVSVISNSEITTQRIQILR